MVEYSNVNKVKTECNCPATCTEIAYKAQLSSSQLSKFYAEEKAGWSSLNCFPGDRNCEIYSLVDKNVILTLTKAAHFVENLLLSWLQTLAMKLFISMITIETILR